MLQLPDESHTPPELRALVKFSVGLLGDVLRDALGPKIFKHIELVRRSMVTLREQEDSAVHKSLLEVIAGFRTFKPREQLAIARAYTLMLELINSCENAYRSQRLETAPTSAAPREIHGPMPEALIYVLTAHPTEARAPKNIALFRLIQEILIGILDKTATAKQSEKELRRLLREAWLTYITRRKAPGVSEEAAYIYSILLEPTTLDSLLEASFETVPVYVRSWVGGDKDGHPGVNEKVMGQSLNLSRAKLVNYALNHLRPVLAGAATRDKKFNARAAELRRLLNTLKTIRAGDGVKLAAFRRKFFDFFKDYGSRFGSNTTSVAQLRRLMHVFPALVVPLEFRESSKVLLLPRTDKLRQPIQNMLTSLAKFSKGADPRWYVRGFIISMASSLEHLQIADREVSRALRVKKIPVVPLFEEADALTRSVEIVEAWLADPALGSDIRNLWNNQCEIMVGYSDSSKESGVLSSRLEIAEAMHRLEAACLKQNVQPIFFQGSGGSVDRGGGSVQDQLAWWPQTALKVYKVTIQGEMVERSLTSPAITRGQILRIAYSARDALERPAAAPHTPIIHSFADSVAKIFRQTVADPPFIELIEKVTPYPDLGELHIGSRPARRSTKLSLKDLRAIPWVLCWTQTRTLFPTWWGVGSSWKTLSPQERLALRAAYRQEPVFASYIRALGFSVAKVELGVFRIYLEESDLAPELQKKYLEQFREEFAQTLEMLQFVSESTNPLWFRPWLGASIRLRAPMIHPLNLLQILSRQNKDFELFRVTVTGISNGMLATG